MEITGSQVFHHDHARRDAYHARREALIRIGLLSDLITRGVALTTRGVKEGRTTAPGAWSYHARREDCRVEDQRPQI
ncbi:unnamed protein product [Trifolium pratense]|uniref:Uncharacterized protein n=1 Tax=Trifolium pratense TaxID=57577 RepID=A0ACB0LHU5_TRIPR|nr:unnamed protein product [Trifolium pratense]